MNPQKNYIDERGNYHNVENLTLTQIHDRASEEGYRLGKAEAQQKNTDGDTISRSALINAFSKWLGCDEIPAAIVADTIEDAPAVELDEDIIQKFLNKRCMSIVANEYLIKLHGSRPQGEWLTTWDADEFICDKCRDLIKQPLNQGAPIYKFCPNCGAWMKTKKEGQADE